MVNFESNNAEKPYVSGAMYNGKEISGYATPDNRYKVLHSRIGNRLIMDDETGDVTLESQKGQTIAVFYGDGNIDITAPKNINISAGEDINITAGKNMNTSVGMNSTKTIGMNNMQSVGMMSMTTIAGDASMFITGKLTEMIEGDVISESKKDRKEYSAQDMEIQSEGNIKSILRRPFLIMDQKNLILTNYE